MEDAPDNPGERRAGTVTRIEAQKRNPLRVNVYLDDAFAFGMHVDLLIAYEIARGTHVDVATQQRIAADDEALVARAAAIRYAGTRPRTRAEVRQYLGRKHFSPPAVERGIARLDELGYLDDAAYAQDYVTSRVRNKGYGRRRIAAELSRKGVSGPLIEAALNAGVSDDEELARALRAAEPRWARLLSGESDSLKRKKKLNDYLLRRGFGYETVTRVFDRLGA
jgi:regulatory protein